MCSSDLNPKSQQGLVQLAVEIGRSPHHSTVIHPLSLIQFETDYSFGNLPKEADRQIRDRQEKISKSLLKLALPDVDLVIQPIVQLSNDVARSTYDLTTTKNIDLVIVGWHRPTIGSNRLGGRVKQILSVVPADVAVFVDLERKHNDPIFKEILLPYSANVHTQLGLELCIRLLLDVPDRRLTILQVHQSDNPVQLSHEFNQLMDRLPPHLRDRITTTDLATPMPIDVVIEASSSFDLTIAGSSREWGIERQNLGHYSDSLAARCRSPLLLTRRFNQVSPDNLDRILKV